MTGFDDWTAERLWQAHGVFQKRIDSLRENMYLGHDVAQSKLALQRASIESNEKMLERLEDELSRRGEL